LIICHCNRIGHRQIVRACADMRAANPDAPVTTAAVYGALGVRPRCGRCAALVAQFIRGNGAPAGQACCGGICARAGGEAQAAATLPPDPSVL
jgi:bacterioferritin-associated ferredoxin